MKKRYDYRSKSAGELDKLTLEMKYSIAKDQMELGLRKLKNTNQVANQKIELARILTVRKEKNL